MTSEAILALEEATAELGIPQDPCPALGAAERRAAGVKKK